MEDALKQKENVSTVSLQTFLHSLRAAREFVLAHSAEFICAGLLLAMTGILLTTIARKSITNDETVLIPSAYYHWVTSDFQLVREHPPLCKLLGGLPILFIQPNELAPQHVDQAAPREVQDWAREMRFWEDNRPLFQSISFWARVPMIALTIMLGVLIFVFA